MDYALRLPQTGSVVHVGLFTQHVNAAVTASLEPLLFLLLAMALIGTVVLMLVARTVSRPIRLLSEQAEKISMGSLDEMIEINAGGEVWQLAHSFKRMLASIRYMTEQVRQNQEKSRGERLS
jgi:methyl-accepting chemotaxis protein